MNKSLQFGRDLLAHKGGVFQAARDYNQALGGTICSLFDPAEDSSGKVENINYYTTGSDILSRLAGRVKGSERSRLFDELSAASHIFLHGSFRLSASYVLDACSDRSHRKSLYYIPHGSLDPWVFEKRGLLKRLWLKRYGARLFSESRAVLAMTNNELRKIQMLAGTRKNQKVVYLPLELDSCRQTEDRSVVRSRWGIPEDVTVCCYLGRLHAMKRPVETIDVVLSLPEKIHLVVAGPDDSYTSAQLRQYLVAHEAADRIHVVGPVYGSEKYNLLASCDAYISLSHRENFNYTAVEAMGMGLPLILSPGNDLQGEVSHIDCGWMLKSLGLRDVQSALKDLLSISDAERILKGARGRIWVSENLSFDCFGEKLNELL